MEKASIISGKHAGTNVTGDAARERYYDLKRRVLGWEKNNYTRLAVIKTGNGWYKMFGHSAIVFVCQIAKRLDIPAELVSDSDYEQTSDEPVYLFKDLAKLEGRLKTLKIFRSSSEDGVMVFDLGYKVDAADLVAMQKEDQLVRERANKLVLPKEIFPGYRNELRILLGSIYEIVRKQNGVARELCGNSMMLICSRMMENFIEAANGHADMKQYMKTSVKDLRRIDAKLFVMSELRLETDNKIYNTMLQVAKTQKKAAGALQKLDHKGNTNEEAH